MAPLLPRQRGHVRLSNLQVHTPVHASWLNLVEVAFSKMARTFLRHLRVGSLDELRLRILQGIEEMNAEPAPFRWKSFDSLMPDYMTANQ